MGDYIFKPGNIWSGNRELAVLTNPNQLAFKKGNLKLKYPIQYEGDWYVDVEDAYQENKIDGGQWDKVLMIQLISIKLRTYPKIADAIEVSGGVEFLKKCTHEVYGKSKWEGKGVLSPFIMALICAYLLHKKIKV